MDLSGIIFVVLALAWALYLIPKAVKQPDEVDPNRSVVVTPPRSGERVLVPSRPAPGSADSSGQVARPLRNVAARRAVARAAARRRRRATLVLVLVDLAAVVVAAFAVTPWWSVAVPVALTLLYLVLCRRQVRKEYDALWAPQARPGESSTPRRGAARVDTSYGSAPPEHRSTAHDRNPSSDVRTPVTDTDAVPVAVETSDGGSLWDPLPVTLPTYVNKARAPRTVRTIDLGAPGTWTSGRDETDSALVDESFVPESAEAAAVHEHRRAVGS